MFDLQKEHHFFFKWPEDLGAWFLCCMRAEVDCAFEKKYWLLDCLQVIYIFVNIIYHNFKFDKNKTYKNKHFTMKKISNDMKKKSSMKEKFENLIQNTLDRHYYSKLKL